MIDTDKNYIIESNLLRQPFLLYIENTVLPMETIFSNSNKYLKDLEDFEINKKKYEIKFNKINEYESEMSLFINKDFEFSCTLLYQPIKLNLKDLNLSVEEINLYSEKQLKQIISTYDLKYLFFDNNDTTLDPSKSHKSLKEVTIMRKKIYDVDNKIFLDMIEKYLEFLDIDKSQKIIEINPLLLSFNFKDIFKEKMINDKTFKLILNEDRNKFIQRITDFINSEKKFLWMVGSDGIGKTISFMYYTLISEENILYLNLKLFNENNYKAEENLANDIIRYFYIKKVNKDSKALKNTKGQLIYILNSIFSSQTNSKKLLKNNFWLLLKNLVFEISIAHYDKPLIIILDQYRDLNIDVNYQFLNDFFESVNKKNSKVIISSSINNYNIESTFFNNIKNFSFSSDCEEAYLDNSEFNDIIFDEYDVNQECEFFEKVLKKKEKNKNIVIINDDVVEQDDSLLSLNKAFKDITLKVYYPSLVSGKDLSNDFQIEEIKCFQNFNFNLKYINKYINFKNNYQQGKIMKNTETNKDNKEKENKFIKILNNNIEKSTYSQKSEKNTNIIEKNIDEKNNKNKEKTINENINILEIIDKFYESCNNHIASKIQEFYSKIDSNKNIKSISIDEYNKLKELRDFIFNETTFSISDLRKKMGSYPGKYLYIRQHNYLYSESDNNKNVNNFQIEYSNTFFNFAINNLVKNLEKEIDITYNNDLRGSGAGVNFESKVINSILNSPKPIFGNLKFNKRRVFSLVGKTSNSKKTVQHHREEEKNNRLYKFYNIYEYSDLIDDIDYEESDVEKIKLSQDLYLIIQVSKNGRSFDFAILKKIENSNEWYLYLFQATINKNSELKQKKKYVYDSILCESYLSKLYKIKIIKRFFIFVIPKETSDINFINELEKRKICYIYYNFYQFFNKSENIIRNLNFAGSEITDEKEYNLDFYQFKIEKSMKVFNDSIDQYLKRKRKNKRLSSFYTRNLTYILGRGIKLNLSNEIKLKIVYAINEKETLDDNEYEFLFIGNCKLKNVIDVYKKYNLIIFFMFKNFYYFYFRVFYQFNNNIFNKMTKQNFELSNLKAEKYNKNPIELSDIKKNNDLCFCYELLTLNK